MNYRLLTLSLILAGASMAHAQEKAKFSDNLFVGAGVGTMAVFNDGLNSPTFNLNVQVGKYITPTWGVRGVLGGGWQSLEKQNNGFSAYCKKFGELNLDAMINLNSLFGNKNVERALDVYLFGGPTINISSAVSGQVVFEGQGGNMEWGQDESITLTPKNHFVSDDAKIRVGATVGLGLAYNFNKYWAINLEARAGVAPSIFGMGSDCQKAEATGRLNLGVAYTFGGKKFAPATSQAEKDALNDEINKYRSELAQTQADLAQTRNALANAEGKTVEVTKEVQTAGIRAIFFKIGSAQLDDYGKVNIKLAAKTLKANPDKKYKVAGYADKATGSAARNQKLSEMRAQVVYDALIAEGVDKDQLELVGFGGKDNMFEKNFLNRVVILE